MKKQWIVLIISLFFSLLFYQQSSGVNFFIFTVITIATFATMRKQCLSSFKWWAIALATLLSSAMVVIHHSNLAIASSLIGFCMLGGLSAETRLSSLFAFIQGLVAIIAGAIIKFAERLAKKPKKHSQRKKPVNLKLILIALPVLVLFLFVALYKEASPAFSLMIDKINFNFISWPWVFFTLLSFFLLLGFFTSPILRDVWDNDISTSNQLIRRRIKHFRPTKLLSKFKTEYLLGVILMITLNVLLAFVLLSELISSLTTILSASAAQQSQQVHFSVAAVICSVLLATGLILYFFRGNINFYKSNRVLKFLSYTWIVLNVGLLIIAAAHNLHYIESYGLTHRRLGVIVYLILTLLGLVFAFMKVAFCKNFFFLLRAGTLSAYLLMVIMSCVSWNRVITKHQLGNIANPDLEYLISLPNENTDLLVSYVFIHGKTLHKKNTSQKKLLAISERLSMECYDIIGKHELRGWPSYTFAEQSMYVTIMDLLKNNQTSYISPQF